MADDKKDYQDYVDYQNYMSSQKPQAPDQPIGAGLEAAAPTWLKNIVGARAAMQGGLVKGATMGYAPTEKLPGVGQGMQDNPGASKLGQFLGASIPGAAMGAGVASIAPTAAGLMPSVGRIGLNAAGGAAQGALMKPEGDQTRLGNAVAGGATGLGVGSLAELIGALAPIASKVGAKFARMNPAQADAYSADPGTVGQIASELEDPTKMPDLQNRAYQAIANSRKVLRAQGLGNASKLSELIQNTKVPVNASELQGLSPEIDEALATRAPELGEYTRPNTIELGGNEANKIKRSLQDMSSFKPGTLLDPVQAAKNADMAQKAYQLRTAIENAGGPEVGALNKQMQESTLLQNQLRQASKNNPLSFISTEAPDRVAALARAENSGAGGLLDLGNQIGAAKTMVAKDVGSGIPSFPVKALGRAGIRVGNDTSALAKDPQMVQSLLGALLGNK